MSDNPKHLFEAAFDCKTAEAFKAELERAIDQWVKEYKDHAEFGYIFRENARDVLNKQNPESVKHTLGYLATLVPVGETSRTR